MAADDGGGGWFLCLFRAADGAGSGRRPHGARRDGQLLQSSEGYGMLAVWAATSAAWVGALAAASARGRRLLGHGAHRQPLQRLRGGSHGLRRGGAGSGRYEHVRPRAGRGNAAPDADARLRGRRRWKYGRRVHRRTYRVERRGGRRGLRHAHTHRPRQRRGKPLRLPLGLYGRCVQDAVQQRRAVPGAARRRPRHGAVHRRLHRRHGLQRPQERGRGQQRFCLFPVDGRARH